MRLETPAECRRLARQWTADHLISEWYLSRIREAICAHIEAATGERPETLEEQRLDGTVVATWVL